MNTRAQELIEYGNLCGFSLEGMDGKGHYVLTHADGHSVRVAATPGDYRGDDNTRALMRRLSGITPDVGRKSGKFRKGVRLGDFVPASERVDSLSYKFEGLARRHHMLCERINTAESSADARRWVADLLAVEGAIEKLGRPVPPRAFRMRGVAS